MGYTENRSPTFLSSGDPCLDFFFHVVPDTPPQTLIQRLELAWKHDPLKALKLVCNLRGVRGTGKSDREGGYTAMLWLHNHHPKTLACNVASFVDFGYYKDLLEILFRIIDGTDARKLAKEIHEIWKMRGYVTMLKKNEPRITGEEKRIERAKKVIDKFYSDPDFNFLHDRVSDPRDEYAEYEGVEEAHYAYRVRDRLRKQVLVPLRKALELPEVYIGANDWGSIKYNRVASVAMKFYKGKFFEHDGERFKEYLEKVKKGKAKIASGALLPHQIIESLEDGNGGQVAELQWKSMVDDLSKKGKLNNCLAICDVSGSMSGTPMDVSVALGMLVSELSDEPWKGKLITFSAKPELQTVKGDSLAKKSNFVRWMNWGMNTDFQKVFDLLLQVAVDGNLKADQMIKRLFVFSDMEFDQASLNPWETDYQAIVRKFNEKGYGDCVPEIVFWNLRDSRATPVPSHQPGVALVSGFSKNLIKVFLEEGGILSPESVMEAAISGEEYEKLVVLD